MATHGQGEPVNGLHCFVPDFLKPKKYDVHQETHEVEMLEAKLIVHKGEDLAAMDLFLGFIPTTSDPFCKVRFMPKGPTNIGGESVLYLGKTFVQKKTLNPVWNQVFTTTVPKDSVQGNALFQLRIYDKDENSKDDPLGVLFVPIFEHGNGTEEEHKDWYKVREASGKEFQGRIQCTVKLGFAKQEVTKTVGLVEHFFGLKIRIIQAEGFAMTDTNLLGLPSEGDPYVIVRFMRHPDDKKGVPLGKTEWLSNTLNPVWNEVFSTRVPIDELDKHAYFLLRIKDRNDNQKDDSLGRVQVGMEDLRHKISPDNPSVKETKWYDVPKETSPHAQGRIKVKVTLTLLLADSAPSP